MSRERERCDEIGKKLKREGNHHNHVNDHNHNEIGIRRHMLNTITPCAACKLLRRRCAQECPFSPYFSPQEPQKFASVHKVFGASNVSKMLMEVAECDRLDAANSLVYEANVRLRDPVYGCMGAISTLQQQIQNLQGELNLLRGEIIKYKLLRHDEDNINHVNMLPSSSSSHHNHHLLPMLPPAPPPPPPPPPPLPSNSSVSSIYFQHRDPNINNYTTISSGDDDTNNNNISYFG